MIKTLILQRYNLIGSFFFAEPQSNSQKIQIFDLVNMVNHSGLSLSNVLHKYFMLNRFLYLRYFFVANMTKSIINTTL